MTNWILASGNRNKFHELAPILASFGISLGFPDKSSLPAVDENGDTLEANARLKAISAAVAVGQSAIADDTGLFVDALDGAPGVKSARFAGPNATPAQIRMKLLQCLSGIPPKERTAHFRCALAVAGPRGNIIWESSGRCEGTILEKEVGSSPFPYDSIFFVNEAGKTLNTISPSVRDLINHRNRACRNLLSLMQQS